MLSETWMIISMYGLCACILFLTLWVRSLHTKLDLVHEYDLKRLRESSLYLQYTKDNTFEIGSLKRKFEQLPQNKAEKAQKLINEAKKLLEEE
jgi:hypothetical protein